ncbi:hypothetical protein LWI29_019277 [Acer saccharum]|uniref:Uncharacterized protein n=1 Tax=Acer saccharum TaxID=4024 RepID=A0AA39RVZ4_ACESA|nr:hypothetical protein LWI29_019277 [Acer saccharum]
MGSNINRDNVRVVVRINNADSKAREAHVLRQAVDNYFLVASILPIDHIPVTHAHSSSVLALHGDSNSAALLSSRARTTAPVTVPASPPEIATISSHPVPPTPAIAPNPPADQLTLSAPSQPTAPSSHTIAQPFLVPTLDATAQIPTSDAPPKTPTPIVTRSKNNIHKPLTSCHLPMC